MARLLGPALVLQLFLALLFGACTPAERSSSQTAQTEALSSPSLQPRADSEQLNEEPSGSTRPIQRPAANALKVDGSFVAKKNLGVPLHRAFQERTVHGRAQEGAFFQLLETKDAGHWLRVRVEASALLPGTGAQQKNLEFWVIDDYVRLIGLSKQSAKSSWSAAQAETLASQEGLSSEAISASLRACQRSLAKGPPTKAVGAATFNIRWFPDGKPGKKGPARVDSEWLACVLAHLQVPVIALQEIKLTQGAQVALAQVIEHLNQSTGGDFEALFDDCSGAALQHVGLLYDRKRVNLLESEVLSYLNPHGEACEKSLRPGLLGVFQFKLDQSKLRIVSVHLKSGTKARDHRLRRASMSAIAQQPQVETLYLGDFNTMGCSGCSPSITASAERRALAQLAQGSFVKVAPSCSQYYRGSPGLLDGALISHGLKTKAWKGRAAGVCGDLDCQPAAVSRFSFSRKLSDHCPLAFFPEP